MSNDQKTTKKYIYPKEQIQNYNKTFKEKHKEEILTCSVCFKSYSFLNKSYHVHSKHHKIAIQILESLNNPKANLEKAEVSQEAEYKGGV